MKILFYEPMADWFSPHFGTCLELMQRHLDEGDQVTFLGCNSNLESCEPNFYHKNSKCIRCMSKRNNGLKQLKPKIASQLFLYLNESDLSDLDTLQFEFDDIAALKRYTIDNFDIGFASASSLIFGLKDADPDMQKNANLVRRLIRSSFIVYRSFINRLSQGTYDKVYIFNGRFASVRGVLRACQSLGIDCVMHERGCSKHHYALFNNKLPHNIKEFHKNAVHAWNEGAPETREREADNFYTKGRKGQEKSYYSFTSEQDQGRLPDQWNKSITNIVAFTSSEFEFSAISDQWKQPIYKTQLEGLKSISDWLTRNRGDTYHLWIRIHPNPEGISGKTTSQFLSLSGKNVTVISPESKISTYALIDAADKVLSFGTTVGVEASYWGKVSIMAGTSFYKDFDCVHVPESHAETMKMLTSDLSPKSTEGAQIYGYYLETNGTLFKYYRPTGLMEGFYADQKKQVSQFIDILTTYFPSIVNNRLGYRLFCFLARINRKNQHFTRL